MEPPNRARALLPVWQTALLTRGCEAASGGQFFPLELHPVGDRIICTPVMSGSLLPFDVAVLPNQPVTITWDEELSRYIIRTAGHRRAA
jgi:hypothetical protein